VPPSIRTRAIQMAGSLGINALPEQNAPAGAQPAGPQPGTATQQPGTVSPQPGNKAE
jgi:hypothetical protein